MALEFHAGPHAYDLDGVRVPSVTRILLEQGLIRFNGVPAAILERARQRGSAVHRMIHFWNEGDLDEASVDPAYAPYLAAWQRCAAERDIRILLCEYRLASRVHTVAGTLDCLCLIDGEGWLLDYATGDPDHCAKHLQTAAYLGLALEWAREDPRLAGVVHGCSRWRRAAVRLCRDGSFRFREYLDAYDYSRFQTLAAAWHIRALYGGVVHADDLAA